MDTRHLVFSAHFAEEVIFNEHGDIVVPAGREVVQAVVDVLNSRGLQCSEIVQRDYYGWEFQFKYKHATIRGTLQLVDKWILSLVTRFSLRGIFVCGTRSSLREIAEGVAEMLKAGLPCEEVSIYSNNDLTV